MSILSTILGTEAFNSVLFDEVIFSKGLSKIAIRLIGVPFDGMGRKPGQAGAPAALRAVSAEPPDSSWDAERSLNLDRRFNAGLKATNRLRRIATIEFGRSYATQTLRVIGPGLERPG